MWWPACLAAVTTTTLYSSFEVMQRCCTTSSSRAGLWTDTGRDGTDAVKENTCRFMLETLLIQSFNGDATTLANHGCKFLESVGANFTFGDEVISVLEHRDTSEIKLQLRLCWRKKQMLSSSTAISMEILCIEKQSESGPLRTVTVT